VLNVGYDGTGTGCYQLLAFVLLLFLASNACRLLETSLPSLSPS